MDFHFSINKRHNPHNCYGILKISKKERNCCLKCRLMQHDIHRINRGDGILCMETLQKKQEKYW